MKNLMLVIVLFSGLFFTSCYDENGDAIDVGKELDDIGEILADDLLGTFPGIFFLNDHDSIEDTCTVSLREEEGAVISITSSNFPTMYITELREMEDEIIGLVEGRERLRYSKASKQLEIDANHFDLTFVGQKK